MQKRINPLGGGEEEYTPQLIVDREWKSPALLDQRIASVWMWTTANDVTDGYDLLLSASFGRDRVTLKGGGFEIEADFSLKTADVELRFAGCTKSMIDDGATIPDARTKIKDVSTKETKHGYSGCGQVAVGPTGTSGKAQTGAHYEHSSKRSTTTQRESSHLDYRPIGDETIQVGPTGEFLNGTIIHELRRWHVKPSDKNAPSAVVARVKVRENWIRFDSPKVLDSPKGYIKRLQDIFLTPKDQLQKEYFEILLAHLAQTGLKTHQDGKRATIATHILMVKPHEEKAIGLSAGSPRHEIAIDDRALKMYLDAVEGKEVEILKALGVDPEMIPLSKLEAKENKKRERGTHFVPDSAPPHAAETFETIYEMETVPKKALKYSNTVKDLKALGLVITGEQMVGLNVSRGLNAEMVFRRAVSQTDCIRVARSLLAANPEATALQVADAVATALGKHWPTVATKRRNGNAIIRWAVWLEPHLMDTASSSDSALRVAYAIDDEEIKKGRPDTLLRMNEQRLRKLVEQELSLANMGRMLNVTPATVRNWMLRLDLMTPGMRHKAKRKPRPSRKR